jgi:hypothetical protein
VQYFVAILACAFVEIALAVVIFSKQATLEAEVRKIITEAFKTPFNSTMHLSLDQFEKDVSCEKFFAGKKVNFINV